MKTLKEWWHHLIGRKFEIWMDHKNLEYFMVKCDLNRRQVCCSAELMDYDYSLHYKLGSAMKKPISCPEGQILERGWKMTTKKSNYYPPSKNPKYLLV